MFNKIWHRALRSVLISVNLWLKKTHFSHRFAQITLIFMALSKNPVIYHRGERRGRRVLRPIRSSAFSACSAVKSMDIAISLDFLVVSIFINLCRQTQRGCT